ncbi:MAG: hypothetical protein KBD94_00395 [Pyrinomonadaceae bacterium]|nr:hypothetical protein [Pyrinomonadaceae bacterium]
MEETIAEKKERYIDQVCRIELGEARDPNRDEVAERIRFWQSLTSQDRMQATSEIVRRVHFAVAGSRKTSESTATSLGLFGEQGKTISRP